MKTCFKCGQLLPLECFYKHPGMSDGHLNKCKECTKKDVQANYRKNINHYKTYESNRALMPHRIAAREAYQKSEHGREVSRQIKKRWDERNKIKKKSHSLVAEAVRSGRLTRMPCVICGNKKVEGHHPDYSKPLDVIWLCPKHHHALHNKKLMLYPNR